MNILSIVMRELRVLSRRRSAWTVRTLFTAAILSAWASCRARLDPHDVLLAMIVPAVFLFGFGAAIASCDAIGSERRNRTLGLLLLTPLRPLEVLLGKLSACVTQYLLCLVAILPILALPLLGGGVEASSVVRHFLGLLAISLLGMSIGLASSVLCRQVSASGSLSFALMLFLFLAPFFGGAILEESGALTLHFSFFWIGPLYLPLHETPGRPVQYGSWPLNLAIVLGLGLGFLLAAAALFPLIWRRERRTGGGKRRKDPRKRPSGTLGDDENPLRALRRRPGPFHLAFGGLGLIACAGFAQLSFLDPRSSGFSYMFPFFLIAGFAYWRCSLEASSPVGRLQRSGMLELILTAPVPRRSLHSDLALLGGTPFRGIGFLILCGNLILLASAIFIRSSLNPDAVDRLTPFMIPLHLGALAVLPLEIASLRVAGTWLGLRSETPLRASAILFLSYWVAPAVPFLVALIVTDGPGGTDLLPLTAAWHLYRAMFSAAALLWCRRRVRQWIARGFPSAGRSARGHRLLPAAR